jgi:hypothetical protein
MKYADETEACHGGSAAAVTERYAAVKLKRIPGQSERFDEITVVEAMDGKAAVTVPAEGRVVESCPSAFRRKRRAILGRRSGRAAIKTLCQGPGGRIHRTHGLRHEGSGRCSRARPRRISRSYR